ncbi:MAG: GIY-YIG nuclease family protein [Candidatus Cloacimonetes bacterium]|jgi:phosphoenolpyruvate synthase/pyruvate phosphate dikinase|nr:GIY-YIG nuclease family protein [Candidatus Cloacimonadota bacterium]NLO44306.1 GIY-YIG nuclease family protein [Candidatus Cloacimonadota bacterium]
MSKQFFTTRPETDPRIYAYSDNSPNFKGLLKVGYTTRKVIERVREQYPIKLPVEKPFCIEFDESAMRNDGSTFTDHDIHRMLKYNGIRNPAGEWFECTVSQLQAAYNAVKDKQIYEIDRAQSFNLRPEQEAAISQTIDYYSSWYADENNARNAPHFLWNAKMRFGKTFAAYKLALRMGWTRVLVLTFKPAVQNAWEEDLLSHIDFEGWQFIKPGGLDIKDADMERPLVCFGSFQDFLGRNTNTGGIKAKNEWVHAINWDAVILDEYHYGAWRENAKELFEAEDDDERKFGEGEGVEYYDEDILPITTDYYLYLSGTPFRAIASGEFIEEQIFNWTYGDEQAAKAEWKGEDNPYLALPKMVLLTYQLPDAIRDIALKGEFNEFDLNLFFAAEGVGKNAKFLHEEEVQKWLDLIRGAFLSTSINDLKLGAQKPPFPFSDVRLLNTLTHTFWFLPSVASCYAMSNLLQKRVNTFYHDYNIVVAAGPRAGIGAAALPPVMEAMEDPLKSKSITLSCGKLTTGVTVKPWTGIFMLRNTSSPESYFQAAFRVQSPWTLKNPDGLSPNEELILKKQCYVFDFAPDRALKQIADYSCRLNVNENNPEKKVEEFIKFLPVLAYDGSSMKEIDAAGILDMALSGTTATLLARRWESALLVNVDNITLKRLISNERAMQALMQIEGFRRLNQDIETIINKSEAVNQIKREKSEEKLSKEEKKELTDDEKEFRSKRKQIQEKLIKFATRIPIFMYLTDYRERSLKDVIIQLEPGLFKKVTGLNVNDFELLMSLGLFNSQLMNDAIYKFKRYEDASLEYTGVNRHAGMDIGLYDTVLRNGGGKV